MSKSNPKEGILNSISLLYKGHLFYIFTKLLVFNEPTFFTTIDPVFYFSLCFLFPSLYY